MRWRLLIEEFSHDLQYIKEDNNAVADALSCLPQKSTSCEDSENSFYALVECHNKEHNNTRKYDFHPLSNEHLEAGKRDSHLKYIIPASIN